MNVNRKFIRKRKRELKKLNKHKINRLDIILTSSLILALFSTILGGLNYFYYTGGRPEGVIHTKHEGTYHVDEEPPGKPEYKSAASCYFIAAAIGYSMSLTAWMAKRIGKKLKEDKGVRRIKGSGFGFRGSDKSHEKGGPFLTAFQFRIVTKRR